MRPVLAAALLVLAAPASGQETPTAVYTQSQTAFEAARQEAQAGRWEAAVPHAEAAVAARPGQTTYRFWLARAYAEAGRIDDARRALRDLAALGVVVSREALDPALDRLDADGSLRAAFDANRRLVGRADTAAVWGDRTFGPEGVAVDGDRVFVSSMRRGEIVVVEGGDARPFAALDGATFRGLAADSERRRLWAGVATSDTTGGLAAFDLDAGASLLDLVPLGSPVGDLTIGPDGRVYASTASGAVVRVGPDAEAVETLVEPGVLLSPQGLVVLDDAVVVADYATGLHRLSLTTGALTPLDPGLTTLLGIDGLVGRGDTLYAVQNGIRPFRVLRLHLDGDRVRAEVVLANDDRLGEPTNAALTEAGLLVVANAVWPLLDADGDFDTEAASDPLVLRLDD